ncbi:MAG: hypothetical protein LUG99_21425 [Lachnospiraceae bacterium]|nr:hypothetical protein [Lachnospiraceae bacterium]
MSYLVLLTETLLSLIANEGSIPEEFTNNLSNVHSFSSRVEAEEYISSELSFDELYEFGVEYGLDVDGRRIYYRPDRKR